MIEQIETLRLVMNKYFQYYVTVAKSNGAETKLVHALSNVCCIKMSFDEINAKLAGISVEMDPLLSISGSFLKRGIAIANRFEEGGLEALNQDLKNWMDAALQSTSCAEQWELLTSLNDRISDVIFFLPHVIRGMEADLAVDADGLLTRNSRYNDYTEPMGYVRLQRLHEAMVTAGMEPPSTINVLLPVGRPEYEVLNSDDRPVIGKYLPEIFFTSKSILRHGVLPVIGLNISGYPENDLFLLEDIKAVRFSSSADSYTPRYDDKSPSKLEMRWNSVFHYLWFRGFSGDRSTNGIPPSATTHEAEWLMEHRLLPPFSFELCSQIWWGEDYGFRFVAEFNSYGSEPMLYELRSQSISDLPSATELLHSIHAGSLSNEEYIVYRGNEIIPRLSEIPTLSRPPR